MLRRAQLPDDLLSRDGVRLGAESFLPFVDELDAGVDPRFWVRLTEALKPETFTLAVFAPPCSSDLATAAERLARFQPLMGPIVRDVRDASDGLEADSRLERYVYSP